MSATQDTAVTADRRIPQIDVVRGFALCGILVPNIIGITGMPARPGAGEAFYEIALHQRSFPIFSFLFGLSCALFLRSAARRSDEPRTVLLIRLACLIPFGAAHQFLQPGEVLLPYAIIGLVILLPASFLPREAVLALGLLATVAALTFVPGGTLLVPGLFLLGLATAEYDVQDNLEAHTKWISAAFITAACSAAVLNFWQVSEDLVAYESNLTAIAGVTTAAVYTTGLVLLLRTPAGRPISAVLTPLGRMALTNYLSATVLIVLANLALRLEDAAGYGTVFTLAAAILTIQTIFSHHWLTRYRYGPAEWLWRSLTWMQRVPNRPRDRPLS